MRKIVFVSLILCVLLGMCVVTAAAETQTVDATIAMFDIPAKVVLRSAGNVQENEGSSYYSCSYVLNDLDPAEYGAASVRMDIWMRMCPDAEDARASFEESYGPAAWMEKLDDGTALGTSWYSGHLKNKDGEWDETVQRFVNLRGNFIFQVSFRLEGIVEITPTMKQSFQQMAVPVLMSLRSPSGEAVGQAASAKKAYTISRVLLSLPADLPAYMGTWQADGESPRPMLMVYPDGYMMNVYVFDYAADGINFDVSSGDEQKDNFCYILKRIYNLNNSKWLTPVVEGSIERDIGMPDGEPVILANLQDYGAHVLTHCFDGTGFMLTAEFAQGVTSEELYRQLEEIALTFRLDGMTEEEMAAAGAAKVPSVTKAPTATKEPAPTKAPAEDAAKKYVVVTAASGKIRAEASLSGGLIKTAYKGEKYELIKQSGDWYVIHVDGRTGYLHKGVAEIQ